VTIISAATLSAAQEADVLAALQANPANAGKDIAVEYKVDEAIIGGL
jgi:F0F1-type ATP synthase delta subunit